MHSAQSMTIGMCTAGLPGIDNVNLASHTMREGKSRSWWSRGASKLKKPTQDALARTVTEGQQVQHGSACTDASGASGFTTVSGKVRGAAAGAGIGCSQSCSVFSHRPPASPRTVLRRPDSFTLGKPKSSPRFGLDRQGLNVSNCERVTHVILKRLITRYQSSKKDRA